MNCPSRTDDIFGHPEWNERPPTFSADLTTRRDLNGIANAREHRDHDPRSEAGGEERQALDMATRLVSEPEQGPPTRSHGRGFLQRPIRKRFPSELSCILTKNVGDAKGRAGDVMRKYAHFVGPGFLISVAYMDPGNYATDVGAGANDRFKLLFTVLLASLFAVLLQSLAIKLGSVTGLDLAENCRAHFPRWLTYILYFFYEAAIIATDMAEVLGSCIALNLLFGIPLWGGSLITLVDVFFILLFYQPSGSMIRLRLFEAFVAGLVLAVVVCFGIQLSYTRNTTVGEVMKGYIPSSSVVNGEGVYLSCGILGATVMPHSIFLGSGLVLPRLRDFEVSEGHDPDPLEPTDGQRKYRPTVITIKSCLKYSIVELAASLLTFALFVNSAILVVAGANLYGNSEAQDANLFGVHALLVRDVASAAGVLFALSLLLSGTSAGIVCTMAGQMVSEGMLNWKTRPWVRRLVTRTISIIPSVAIAASIGEQGINEALLASQIVLCAILPFVIGPLVYFTCRNKYMTVPVGDVAGEGTRGEGVKMRNHWITGVVAVAVWLLICIMVLTLFSKGTQYLG